MQLVVTSDSHAGRSAAPPVGELPVDVDVTVPAGGVARAGGQS
jgi:hypothetical protein